jgi:hypothetical protein
LVANGAIPNALRLESPRPTANDLRVEILDFDEPAG